MPTQLLPPAAYTSADWFARERTELFGRTWTMAGMESDLRQSGDLVALTTGAYPLAVLRDGSGMLRGFHNLCRHRGTELLEGSGNAGATVVCPYHRWTYGLDGALRGVPDRAACFPDLDRDALGLRPAAVGVWQGVVFVNLTLTGV